MYYYINGRIFNANDLDAKRKKMFEDRGFKQLTKAEIEALKNA